MCKKTVACLMVSAWAEDTDSKRPGICFDESPAQFGSGRFTPHRNMRAGSTWWKSKSACCATCIFSPLMGGQRHLCIECRAIGLACSSYDGRS